jgi:hypothetical protein
MMMGQKRLGVPTAAVSAGRPPGAAAVVASDRWLAVWDGGVAVLAARRAGDDLAPKAALTLYLEFTLPSVGRSGLLRLWQGMAAPDRAFGFYAQMDGALRLVHQEIDLSTPAGFVRPGDTVSLRYRSCARGRGDIADFTNYDRGTRLRLRAAIPHAVQLDEVWPRDPGFLSLCHIAAIADFGLSAGDLPALAAGAVMSTDIGPVPVEHLRAGMMLRRVDGDLTPLRWIERRPRLCLGRLAPIRLRAPYFGLSQDIRVTPETRILRSGPAVEYLFGHEHVLISAGDMTSSPGAVRDRQRPVCDMYHLMLDDHGCVSVDRCGVETALLSDVVAAEDVGPPRHLTEADRTPFLPVLDRAGAQALMASSAGGCSR